jgi:hypothetical protein
MDTLAPPSASLPESLRVFLAEDAPAREVIKKINYSHEGFIDEIVRNPGISQRQLAAIFGYTEGWVSQVIATDAFQAALAKRKEEIIDPALKATVEERLKGLVLQSAAKLMQKLEANPSDDLTLGVLNAASKALGYGAKSVAPVVNNQFVVQVPAKASSSEVWAERHNPNSASRSAEALPATSRPAIEPPPGDEGELVSAATRAEAPAPAAPNPPPVGAILTEEVISA